MHPLDKIIFLYATARYRMAGPKGVLYNEVSLYIQYSILTIYWGLQNLCTKRQIYPKSVKLSLLILAYQVAYNNLVGSAYNSLSIELGLSSLPSWCKDSAIPSIHQSVFSLSISKASSYMFSSP